MLRQREKRAETEPEREEEEEGGITLPGCRCSHLLDSDLSQLEVAGNGGHPTNLTFYYYTSVSMSIKLFMAKYNRKH